MYSIKELYNLAENELDKELSNAKKELFKSEIELRSTSKKETHKANNVKKYIARIYTIKNNQKS